jgi:hypothetical protein
MIRAVFVDSYMELNQASGRGYDNYNDDAVSQTPGRSAKS